jgi:hypothetical protein
MPDLVPKYEVVSGQMQTRAFRIHKRISSRTSKRFLRGIRHKGKKLFIYLRILRFLPQRTLPLV